ncbi:type II toxin-antitoxin system HicA family toxin [Dactylococcopsis salina]|uniref:YcfA-like protein n=1 Tax=Dactylococcopsis salina (strain PCC 8305) TaxID=13035 RepID=K9YSG0_DACS8|nr:type II toxin-antitoxin system HicA family toxin [Dactylococcopsis salina]AFZ49053.1 YcfA-like protein [Dactylococcopsis salina PCC 8305]
MKIPRDLKGSDFARVLCRQWDYKVVHQQGSHIILDTEIPSHQRISIPNHNPLRLGTLNSILRAVSRHKGVAKAEIINTL